MSDALAGALERLERDAERYRWLTDGKRDDWIWNHVLTEDDRKLGNWTDDVIDAAIARQKSEQPNAEVSGPQGSA